MTKPRPEDFPNIRGDAKMLPYFATMPRVPLQENMRYSKLPECAAIYFAYAEPDLIFYIGKSTNLKDRWANGHRLFRLSVFGIRDVFVVWMPCEVSTLDIVEQSLIRKLRPVANNQYCSRNYHSFLYEINERRSSEWTIS